ncbi:ATP-binding protein [Streptomyces sp. BI20]|uniref:ATP-binding protein n=1 Tax=Streptomyces sp. BI20 TaxID=3403460 RepID=UPI003C78C412
MSQESSSSTPFPSLRRDVGMYPPRQDSVTAARRHVAGMVALWGQPGLAFDAGLVTSELVTNAIFHGTVRGRLVRVEVELRGDCVRVAVSDSRGERRPAVREVGAEDRFGRGLLVVAGTSRAWGCEDRVVGKTVWAELALG